MATLFEQRKRGRKDPADALYIKEIEPPQKGRRIITDTHRDAPRGFALRVNANGSKAFVIRYMHGGRDRLLSVGEHPTWSLAAAREKARGYRKDVDSGTDVLEARRAERQEPTVSDCCARFIAAKRAAGMKSVDDIERLFRLYLLPAVGQKRMASVRRRDVIALVERLANDTPRQASLLLSYTKQLAAWAEDRDILEANPVATLRAEKVSPALATRPRARVLDAEELRRLWNNAEHCGLHRLTALALKLTLLTGQRPGEVAGMRWDEVDSNVWTIQAGRRKTGIAHGVPLTDTAIGILESVQTETARLRRRRDTDASEFVFETRPRRPITTAGLSRAVKRYTEALGNRDDPDEGHWRPHDLRRTARTGMAAAGVAENIAERVIGHVVPGVRGIYDRHGYDAEKRAALEQWERRLRGIIGKPQSADVVSIAEARA